MPKEEIENQFLELIKKVWKEIWGSELNIGFQEFKEKYAGDIRLPVVQKNSSGEDVYLAQIRKKVISLQERTEKEKAQGFLVNKESINSIEDLFEKVKKVNYFSGSFTQNSQNVFYSDLINSSENVLLSRSLFNCKRMALSYSMRDCEMTFASEDSAECSYCIRVFESKLLNNCFDAYYCGKCSNACFIHDSYDLRDCMFCFHLVSKQYCIANMQYEKEEYDKIKKMLVDYIASENIPDIEMS